MQWVECFRLGSTSQVTVLGNKHISGEIVCVLGLMVSYFFLIIQCSFSAYSLDGEEENIN